MAQHGYLREYDEDYRDEDRERGSVDRRDLDRDWRGERRFMFGDEDRGRFSERGMSQYGREQGGYSRGRRSFSSPYDDHYRSWRDQQMQALDRDYEDYCREREQQFHQDFDSWRRQRQANQPHLQAGMTQSGASGDPAGTLELTREQTSRRPTPDPTATATLGTTSGGRGRR